MKYSLVAITALSFLAFIHAARADSAASPVGEWKVANGGAHIRVMACDAKLWGVISWTKEPGADENNPDPSKRTRPLLGMPIMLAMQPVKENQWEGYIYNSDNGKTYEGSITLKSKDSLRIEGCVLGMLCGGENWTRIAPSGKDFPCPN